MLYENDIRQNSANLNDFNRLYHITDYIGLSYSVSTNTLTSLRQTGVSFTYSKNVNSVGGRNHYDFKLILDSKKLYEDSYNAHYYKSLASVSDGTTHTYDEKEVRIEEAEIKPLSRYLNGVVILIDIFSRKFIQWMFYKITETTSFFGTTTSGAPRGIDSLRKLVMEWNVILYRQGNKIRRLNQNELKFISECYKLAMDPDENFRSALKKLTYLFPNIKDHFGNILSHETVNREDHAHDIMNKINHQLAGIPIKKIDPKKTRQVILSCIKQLGYNDNIVKNFDHIFSELQLYSPAIEPVVWSSIFKDFINGNLDDIYDGAVFLSRRESHKIKRFNDAMAGNDTFMHFDNMRHLKSVLS